MVKQVEHEGIVASVCGNKMVVRVVTSSACGSCVAKGHCMPAENRDMDIHIDSFSGNFETGEQVTLVMRQSLGMRALFICYLVPFVLAFTALIVVYQTTRNELASGLASLFILVPYYFMLKMFNQKITKSFGFTVKKK